jgi:hypothetical protein
LFFICTMDKYNRAYELYLKGFSLRKVGSLIGVSRQSVCKAFKRRGYQVRGVNFKPYQEYEGKVFVLKGTGHYHLDTDDSVLMEGYVWSSLNGPVLEGHEIIHISGDMSDNRIENLRCIPVYDAVNPSAVRPGSPMKGGSDAGN